MINRNSAVIGARVGALHWLYPLVGAGLSFVMVLGLLCIRNLHCGAPFSLQWTLAELNAESGTYSYVAVSTLILFVALGGVLGRKEDRLWASSITDPGTRLSNRRYFDACLIRELACAEHCATSLSLLFIDVDHLKRINDEHGHEVGDAALQLVAESLRATCRARDLAARWGGDEFMVLVPATSAEQAVTLAERIRQCLTRLASADAEVPAGLTVSIGISDVDRIGTRQADLLFASADRALYLAKQQGRDCVSIAPRPGLRPPRRLGLVTSSQEKANAHD